MLSPVTVTFEIVETGFFFSIYMSVFMSMSSLWCVWASFCLAVMTCFMCGVRIFASFFSSCSSLSEVFLRMQFSFDFRYVPFSSLSWSHTWWGLIFPCVWVFYVFDCFRSLARHVVCGSLSSPFRVGGTGQSFCQTATGIPARLGCCQQVFSSFFHRGYARIWGVF